MSVLKVSKQLFSSSCRNILCKQLSCNPINHYIDVTGSAIWGLLDKDDDIRESYEVLSNKIIL